MVQTARDFCEDALRAAGIVGVGQTALDQDIVDAFKALNRMLAQWQKRRWLVPNLYSVSAVANGAKSNLIGPGQYYNAARPDKIQAAYFRQIGADLGGPNQVTFPLIRINSWEDYSLLALKELRSWPQYFFYDAAYPYGNVYVWPIPDNTYEVSLVLKGPIGFTTQIADGRIDTVGSGYQDGNHIAIDLLNVKGFGYEATANVTVLGGEITAFEIQNPGNGYKIGDVLTLNTFNMGGIGEGFTYTVTNVTDELDSEFTMPPDYEEAILYNLVVRLVANYGYPAQPVQGALAVKALNTIRNANAQIPSLQMPQALRWNRGGNFYIFNADNQ